MKNMAFLCVLLCGLCAAASAAGEPPAPPVVAIADYIHKMVEHFVTVLPGDSLVSRVFGEGRLKVNSSHKYRCVTVAPGFRATALSEDDGVVEAIQHETLPIYGFQFHPEYCWGDNPKFLELLKASLR